MYRKKCFKLFQSFGSRRFVSKWNKDLLEVKEDVRLALRDSKAVVALESTIITHGMPFPDNVKCALEVEDIVRCQGAVPATIAILKGKIKVGLSQSEIELLGNIEVSKPVKTSRRDFPYILSNGFNGGTTVSGTVVVCKEAGISVFATGGIGGVHRGANQTFDISADLTELGRSNVAVVSSGVKSILDIPKTLEYLETQGVFVATVGPNAEFPAFYSSSSGCHAPYCVQDCNEAAKIIKAHKDMGLRSGLLFAVPVPARYAFNPELIDRIIKDALKIADKAGIRGKDVTPFLLSEIAKITDGNSLETNIALIRNNAKVAAEISVKLSELENTSTAVEERKLDRTSNGRPVIIGGCNLDCVAHLDADEIKLDGRIHVGCFDYSPGGVGRNICEALGKLGCPSHFISAVGDDQQGRLLSSFIPKESSEHLKVLNGYRSAQCTVVLDKKGDCSFLMGDMSIHSMITPKMIEENEEIIEKSPMMILDSNISEESIEKALELAQKYKVPVFYEPTDVSLSRRAFKTSNWNAIKFITPNLNELKHISTFLNINTKGKYNSKLEEASLIAKKIAHYIDNVIVTLGPDGILIARKGFATDPFLKNLKTDNISVRHYPVKKVTDFINVSGAGDCFASGLIAAILENLPEEICVSVGFAAALTALHSQSPVPFNIFNKNHYSWSESAQYVTTF